MKMKCIDLFDGKIGNILIEDEFDYWFGELIEEEELCDVEDFDFNEKELFLLEYGKGYRGNGCYEGVIVNKDGVFLIEIVNDGLIWKVKDEGVFDRNNFVLKYRN